MSPRPEFWVSGWISEPTHEKVPEAFLRTLPFLWPFLFHLISLQPQIGCAQFSLCLPSFPGPSLHHKALPNLIDPFAAPFWMTVMITPFSSVPRLSPALGAPAMEFQWFHKPTEEQPALSQSGSPSSIGLTCPGRGSYSWFPGALHKTTAPASCLLCSPRCSLGSLP